MHGFKSPLFVCNLQITHNVSALPVSRQGMHSRWLKTEDAGKGGSVEDGSRTIISIPSIQTSTSTTVNLIQRTLYTLTLNQELEAVQL